MRIHVAHGHHYENSSSARLYALYALRYDIMMNADSQRNGKARAGQLVIFTII